MRQTIRQRPQQLKEMESMLLKLSQIMTEFDGLMRIEYARQSQMPEVTEVIDSRDDYEEIVRRKLARRN